MNFIKSVWDFANGKKAVIAALSGTALSWAQAKGFVSPEDAIYLAAALTALTGLAVGHKLVKSGQGESL